MVQLNSSQKKLLIVVGISAVIVLLLIVTAFLNQNRTNQFGNFVKIQDIESETADLPTDIRESIESYLYNIMKLNTDEGSNLSAINDAFVRDDTVSIENDDGISYGTFIVDINSYQQSYFVQFEYSLADIERTVGGTLAVVTCLPDDQLVYPPFDCRSFVSGRADSEDAIIQYLPFENFSFRLAANTTFEEESLLLYAQLRIPTSDLAGNEASRREIVSLYKNEVTSWIESRGLQPGDYTIEYDYSDDGTFIGISN